MDWTETGVAEKVDEKIDLEKTYKEFVADCAKNRKNEVIPNSNMAHAQLIVSNIFKLADKEVCIVSTEFYRPFYSRLLPSIEDFLKKNDASLSVLTTRDADSDFISSLRDKFKDKFNYKKIANKNLLFDKDTNSYLNFIVNDTNSFRYEESDGEKENGVVTAVANFNDEKFSKSLRDAFDVINNI